MSGTAIHDVLQPSGRFLRSTHLERDFGDASSLQGYVLTAQTREAVERIAVGLRPNSGQRAWRITGDYGTGKSSFGLFLAHLFSGPDVALPSHLRASADFAPLATLRPHLLPIFVTGSRESLSVALLRALDRALQPLEESGLSSPVHQAIQNHLRWLPEQAISDDTVLGLVLETAEYVRVSQRAKGLLLILDELGKFLEYAALYPDRQDVYFLQRLAELTARPMQAMLFVVGLLHQGFSAYAGQLPQTAQKEWDKVASRYEEVLFNQPLDETTELLAHALNVRVEQLPLAVAERARMAMRETLDLGWFGPGISRDALIKRAPSLYPFHPTVIPVLVRLFSRYGQNERSLFSFLFSNEPFGLRAFAEGPVSPDNFYRLTNLYDYARGTFGYRLGLQSYRSHWKYIESVIESFDTQDELNLQVLKTVGLLNLLDTPTFIASQEVIQLATCANESATVQASLHDLQKSKFLLYYRGRAGGYCLWPHTSVNLDRAYEEAERALTTSSKVADLIRNSLESQPLVARRHYIETGNLRYFEIRYASVATLATDVRLGGSEADGLLVIPLCETEAEREAALRFARTDPELQTQHQVLVAIPHPLNTLAPVVWELQRWEWVVRNTPELNHDPYAAEEVSRQIDAARRVLDQRLQSFLGVQQRVSQSELRWFRQGQLIPLKGGVELLAYLSTICDEVYDKAPRLTNELLNRRSLSSTAAAARMRLIEHLLRAPTEPWLGMDPRKKPPEMAMYLSVLERGQLHRRIGTGYRLAEPEPDADPCNLRPVFQRIHEILRARPDQRVAVNELWSQLRRPPYGVRDGVIPLLLAVFIGIYEQNVALFENGTFVQELTGFDFLRLMKAPETFDIQFYETGGVRAEVLQRLRGMVGLEATLPLNVLDVVRPLVVFASKLPAYTKQTRHVSLPARAVLSSLINSREPATLLFSELPRACGLVPFHSDAAPQGEQVATYAAALEQAMKELEGAYGLLLRQCASQVNRLVVGTETASRETISERARQLLDRVQEPRLKGFCLRLSDDALPAEEWMAAIGSFVCAKPPAKWLDSDGERFSQELMVLAARFRRAADITFTPGEAPPRSAYHVVMTRADGEEVRKVLYLNEAEEAEVAGIEAQVIEQLQGSEQARLLAVSRALWTLLRQVPTAPVERE